MLTVQENDVTTLTEKELKVVFQNEINVYLHRALPLCAILADRRFIPWYYEHFIEIVSETADSGEIKFEFLENEAPYNNIMRWICMGYELLGSITSIVDFVREKINQGYYIIIHLDEYYLPDKEYFQKSHYVHQSMVYGYNDSQGVFQAICFNRQHSFEKVLFDYTSFNQAYESGKLHYTESAPWAEVSAIELLKPKNFLCDYPFDLSRFYHKLQNYMLSRGDSSILYNLESDKVLLKQSQIKYGMQVYEDLIKGSLAIFEEKSIIDYRAFHLVYEHKTALYKRLTYIDTLYDMDLKGLIEEYSLVVKQASKVRFMCLKLTSMLEEGAAYSTIEHTVHRFVDAIRQTATMEYSILEKVCEKIDGVLSKNCQYSATLPTTQKV